MHPTATKHQSQILSQRFFINPLARLAEMAQAQTQSKQSRTSTLLKLKAINKIAQADPSFLPQTDFPFPSFLSASKFSQTHESSLNLSESVQWMQGSTIKKIILSQTMSKHSSPFSQYFPDELMAGAYTYDNDQQFQQFEYCHSCDDKPNCLNQHICTTPITCISHTQDRLERVDKMSQSYNCHKFTSILEQVKASRILQTLSASLQAIEAFAEQELSELESILRMRLLNLVSKKIKLIKAGCMQ